MTQDEANMIGRSVAKHIALLLMLLVIAAVALWFGAETWHQVELRRAAQRELQDAQRNRRATPAERESYTRETPEYKASKAIFEKRWAEMLEQKKRDATGPQ